jgi:thioredoxin-dependent peroxiredoxin
MLGKPVPDFSLPSTGGTFQFSSLRDSYQAFRRAACEVFAISRDSLASHRRFKEKMKFPFGVMKLNNLYGKQVRGIPKGWRGVKVPGHIQEVLNFVKSL